MEFVIQSKSSNLDENDCFVAQIKTMVGDADSYPTFTIGNFKNGCEETKKVMTDLAETLDRMIEKYSKGKRGYDSYTKVEGFERWFGGIGDDFYDSLSEQLQIFFEEYEWPCDKYGNHNQIISYDFFYYDTYGNKHNVIINKN